MVSAGGGSIAVVSGDSMVVDPAPLSNGVVSAGATGSIVVVESADASVVVAVSAVVVVSPVVAVVSVETVVLVSPVGTGTVSVVVAVSVMVASPVVLSVLEAV